MGVKNNAGVREDFEEWLRSKLRIVESRNDPTRFLPLPWIQCSGATSYYWAVAERVFDTKHVTLLMVIADKSNGLRIVGLSWRGIVWMQELYTSGWD